MSSSFYSDSFTSGDYKPSNYTDFTSNSFNSYTSDQDTSYKKFDDYSSSSYGYSDFGSASNPNNTQSNFTNFDSYQNQQKIDDQRNSDTTQKYSNDSLSFQDAYFNRTEPEQQQTPPQFTQPLRQMQQTEQQEEKLPFISVLPPKPRERITVRDVLELQPARQEYLKSLPLENLRQEPEYNALRQRESVLLGIVDYYEKAIPDNEFNGKVKSLKRGKDIKETLWLTSIIGYLVLTGKLQSSQSNFKGIFKKGGPHFMIPIGLTALMMFDNQKTRYKTSVLFKESKYQPSIDIAMRKFICDTNQKERTQIFGQS